MSDFGRSKNSIPAWQRTQKPLSPSSQSTSSSSNSSQTPTDGSDVAAKQEFEASKSVPDGMQPPANVSRVDHFKTDGSDVAAKQEHDASDALPTNLQEAEEPPNNLAKTDGSDVAAKQEFDASQQVIDQVRKFLTDPQVKDAPLEKKRTFLESKGVRQDIITEVLEVESPAAAFSAAEFQSSRQVPPRPQVQREIPPIVTYPEFLMQPQQPPPLVTIDRLMSAAYITGAITASVYGLSKFIISPMSANLSEARHDMASHTSDSLTVMNDKLSGLVSTVPTTVKTKSNAVGADDFDDAESTVSDPTELFHRDIGTQTSPLPSPDEKSEAIAQSEAETTLSKQESRLKIMHSHMSELLADSDKNGDTTSDIQTEVAEFKQYLDSMVYSPPAYQYMPGDSVFTPPGTPGAKKSDDVIKDFKAEIRGVKGVLLSAKRFPSAAAVR